MATPHMRTLIIIVFCAPMVFFGQSVDFDFTQTCLGDQMTLVGSSSVSDTSIASWNWDLDNDGQYDDATGKTIVNLFESAGDMTVGIEIDLNNGGSASAAKTVVIDYLPEVNFSTENLCEGQTGFFNDASTIQDGSITQYIWDFDNDGVDDDTGPNVTYNCGPATTYQSKLECISDQGCHAFAVKTTAVHHVPTVNFDFERLCAQDTTQFANYSQLAQGAVALSVWNFGDGLSQDSEEDVTHVYKVEGDYTAQLKVTSEFGCSDSLAKPLTIVPLPTAELQLSTTNIYPGEMVDATIIGDVVDVKWSNGQTGTDASFGSFGDHRVTLYFNNGCQRAIDFSIDSNAVSGIEVTSDILSPNQDGMNDFLLLNNVRNGETCSITIVNRWNQVVYESSDYQNDWDGTSGGKQLESGAYFYIIQCAGAEPFTGNINILR